MQRLRKRLGHSGPSQVNLSNKLLALVASTVPEMRTGGWIGEGGWGGEFGDGGGGINCGEGGGGGNCGIGGRVTESCEPAGRNQIVHREIFGA